MLITATQIRPGQILNIEGGLHRVLSMTHITPGNWRAIIHVKMRNLKTNVAWEKRFSSDDKVEKAELDTHQMQYLYSDNNGHCFMNVETYEQVILNDEILQEAIPFLVPDTVVDVQFYEGNPVSVELPQTVILEVVETEPHMKGATATASFKPAKLSTGIVVQVPQFIEAGDKIKVDTRDGKYIERA
jgi:elongation factor P